MTLAISIDIKAQSVRLGQLLQKMQSLISLTLQHELRVVLIMQNNEHVLLVHFRCLAILVFHVVLRSRWIARHHN